MLNAGAIVVAASGNDATEAALQPANCPGVISVTAHVINGDNADYANIARRTNPGEVTISAPGGGAPSLLPVVNPPLETTDNAYVIWSTGLFGATTPTSPVSSSDNRSGDAILGLTGTSPATPHVTGTVALMLSLQPSLSSVQVAGILQSSARPHPGGKFFSIFYELEIIITVRFI